MKILIEQSVLNAALKKASGSLSDKELTPMLMNFKITANNYLPMGPPGNTATVLKVQATDLSLSTIVVLKDLIEVEEEGSITVPAKKLLDYASHADSTRIKIESLDNWRIKLSYHTNETELQGVDPDLYPAIEDWIEENSFEIEKDSFMQALERVSPVITDDPTRVNLLMVKIDGGYMQATDSHRMNLIKFESPLSDFKVSKSAVPELVKVLKLSGSKKFKVNITESHNLFYVGGDLFSTRRIKESFPDLMERVIKPARDSNTFLLKIDRVTLKKVIDRVAIASDNEKKEVRLTFNSSSLVVSAKDMDGNTSKEQISCFWNGDDAAEKLFNYEFVDELLLVLKKSQVEFKFAKDDVRKMPLLVEEDDFVAAILQRMPTLG